MATKKEVLDRLVKQAREDPAFFHDLVFAPEKTLAKLDYLDRREKGMIVSINPEDVIAGLAGLLMNPAGDVSVCGISCDPSCDSTCGEGSCFGTCISGSCSQTCGSSSCDITTQIASFGGDVERFGARFGPTTREFRATRRFR
jgi:hypothetical protein